ncbi:hypothetical protein D3C74_462220 [compost metagenome]
MEFHGLDSDNQLIGNILVGFALGQQLQYFHLTFGKLLVGRNLAFGVVAETVHHFGGHLGLQDRLAPGRSTDGIRYFTGQ